MPSIAELIAENEAVLGNTSRAVESWQRALVPGDHIVFSDPPANAGAPATLAYMRLTPPPSAIPDHYVYGLAYAAGKYRDALVAMPRVMALYPLSARQFAVARDAGFPVGVAAVNALLNFQTGGSA